MKAIKILSLVSALTALSACMATDESASKASQTASSSKLAQAITAANRSDKNKARDIYRNPQKTLEFFGFQSDMTVVEIAPGGGWYTEILAPALKGSGKLYAAHFVDAGNNSYYSKSRRNFDKKMASDAVYNEVIVTDFTPKQANNMAPAGSADLVLTFRNLHNWKQAGALQMFKDAYQALKPGGFLGVVQHRMPATQSWDEEKRTGYFPEKLAIDLAYQAGFKLVAKSQINANSKDTADHPKGVWTLPPALRLGEQDKEKYLAIGESDRMTLKFIKPKN